MYSIVLMMAMTSGGDVADFGHHRGGCCGGEAYAGCCGGYVAYSGCCGGESYGCCGGGRRHHHRRHGGGCCGGGYYSGCCGGGYSGCYGGVPVAADCGCGAPVYAGCTGGVVTGGVVTDGPVTGGGVVEEPIKGGHGEEHIKKGDGDKAEAVTAEEQTWLDEILATKKTDADKAKFRDQWKNLFDHKTRKEIHDEYKKGGDKKDGDKKDGDKKDEGKDKTMISAPATIIVSLPADAKLSIDDAATHSTASPRVFTSPVLPAGHDYHYTLKAEMVRNGKPLVISKEVTVRAGEQTRVSLEAGLAGVASR